MKTRIPTQAEYEQEERNRYYKERMRVENAPLIDRQHGFEYYKQCLLNYPENIAVGFRNLAAGNYGWGAAEASWRVIRNKRMNRVAWLAQAVASYNHACPGRHARRAWNQLTGEQQAKIQAMLQTELDDILAGNNDPTKP